MLVSSSDVALQHVSGALDFLYGGPRFCNTTSQSDMITSLTRICPQRAIESLSTRLDLVQALRSPQNDFVTGRHVILQDWEVVNEALSRISHLKENEAGRGVFKLLDADRIDLPSSQFYSKHCSSSDPFSWIERLPEKTSHLFQEDGVDFLSPMLTKLGFSLEEGTLCSIDGADSGIHPRLFPSPRVHCINGHYGRILDKADASGIIEWSLVPGEDRAYSQLADIITMSSFSVTKDEDRDRLISWPRVQNGMLDDPPAVELPNPCLFSRLHIDTASTKKGFYFDISNMFHNIRMPARLYKFFPLRAVAFGNLPGRLQRNLVKLFGRRLHQSEMVRPLQCTLPMGFKWAVYIAHTFAQSCLQEAVENFQLLVGSIPRFNFGRIVPLLDSSGIIVLRPGDALLMHIIDDVNLVAIDWPDVAVRVLHRLAEQAFTQALLPPKRTKSLPLGQIERKGMRFIGWDWNFKTGAIAPRPDKLRMAVTDVSRALSDQSTPANQVERALGRMVWLALGLRPLLSILSQSFAYVESARSGNSPGPSSSVMVKAVRKELAIFVTLAPLSRVILHIPLWLTVIASDASERAGAVVYTHSTAEIIMDIITSYRMVCRERDVLQISSGPVSRLYKSKVHFFVQKHTWTTAFSHEWRRKEHINALEAAAVVLALEWAASFDITGHRLLILSDSLVAIGAMVKGRSSSSRLCLPCRRIAALKVAHDIDLILCHVASSSNPADGPSRTISGKNG